MYNFEAVNRAPIFLCWLPGIFFRREESIVMLIFLLFSEEGGKKLLEGGAPLPPVVESEYTQSFILVTAICQSLTLREM